MDVTLAPEQQQLEDSVRRLLADHGSFAARQKIAGTPLGWSEMLWARYANLGLLGIATPSDWGGLDGGAGDLLPVLQAFGASLVQEPFLASAVLGATALAGSPDEALKREWLASMAAGERRLAFAHEEAGVPIDEAQLQARRAGSAWRLSGSKCSVLHARSADALVVTAQVRPGAQGTGLFLLPADAPGLRRRDYRLLDQRDASDLLLADAPAALLMEPSADADAWMRRTLHIGTAALVAEAAGAMRAALTVTTGYLVTRKQFGRALADFQALRHRCADMLVAVETVEAMAYLAAIAVDTPNVEDSPRDIARAKLLAGRHGRWVGEQAIQLHGGIGMTDEYVVGHYLQRLTVIDALLGNQDAQLNRLAAASP